MLQHKALLIFGTILLGRFFMPNDPSFYSPQQSVPPTDIDIGDNRYEALVISNPAQPYVFHFGNICAMPHWHENVEILYFYGDGGIICDRQSYATSDGDLAVINSNTLHAIPNCDGVTHDCLIIDSAFLSKCNINISEIKFESVIKDAKAAELFRFAMNEIVKMRNGHEYGAAAAKAAILTLMVHLCREHSVNSVGDHIHGDTIKRAIAYIKSNYEEPLSVDLIADSVNVSKFYFCREFKRETGYTVIHYINNLRCREAQRLLSEGKHTVGEAARMCGFKSISYFTRTYKTVIGCTPTESRSKNAGFKAENIQ